MPATSGNTPKGWATGAGGFTPWQDVRYNSGGTWKYAQRVFRCISPGNWAEVWNNRPVTITGVGSSSSYDRITVTGTVDPNNFSTTPRFYYKKSADSVYTAGPELTVIAGDTAQSVGSVTITGLVENTTYNYYLSAVSDAGTSVPGVVSVTTQVDCRELGTDNGWSGSAVVTSGLTCGTCGTRDKTVTTYTKTGCSNSPYTVTSYGTCTEDACGCSTSVPPINGWSETKTRTREVGCPGDCNRQTQSQEYREKAGCTEVIITDWTNTGGCDSGWYRLIPIFGFQYTIMYNYLGDGVDWFALFNNGGFYPSNNVHGGCGTAYKLWYLYRCSYGYADNSRTGQKEENTGVCVPS